MTSAANIFPTVPASASALLLFRDGTCLFGSGVGALGETIGELCFNTGMTGYQEILTDPSYAGQVINFTFPHIGNVGANAEDYETTRPVAAGLVIREAPTLPSNFRAEISLQDWLARHGIIGIAGVDTRMLTKRLRNRGHENILISHFKPGNAPDIAALSVKLLQTESMSGKELALTVTAKAPHNWSEGRFVLGVGYSKPKFLPHHVVVVDYGVKHTILRCLVDVGCRLTVVPGNTSAEEILAYKPDGILLSNGPGDPAATGVYALPVIKKLLSQPDLPIFGICLGHQLLALALGCETEKMVLGHRGCNHPVQDLRSKRVMITSQNHGFVVAEKALPPVIDITHRSLFDGTIQGIRHRNQPVFSVQGHPEASPGPHDSFYLFKEFAAMLAEANR